MTEPYRRVLLKLSGEAFGGGKLGVDPLIVRSVARQIARPRGRGYPGRGRGRRRQLSSAVWSCSAAAWTVTAPTTWACSAR